LLLQGAKIPDAYKFTVLITTFEIIISDCELLSDIDWRVCIIDEAHRLKNKNCKLMEGLKMFDLVRTFTYSLYSFVTLSSGHVEDTEKLAVAVAVVAVR